MIYTEQFNIILFDSGSFNQICEPYYLAGVAHLHLDQEKCILGCVTSDQLIILVPNESKKKLEKKYETDFNHVILAAKQNFVKCGTPFSKLVNAKVCYIPGCQNRKLHVRDIEIKDHHVHVIFSHLETWVLKPRKNHWYLNGKHEKIHDKGIKNWGSIECEFAKQDHALDVQEVEAILQ